MLCLSAFKLQTELVTSGWYNNRVLQKEFQVFETKNLDFQEE